MPAKSEVSILLEDAIAGGAFSIHTEPIVPSGVKVTVLNFGASVSPLLDRPQIALQWGSSGSGWTTIRALASTWDFQLNQTFVGDGNKRFRVVRRHEDTVTNQIIAVWANGVLDQTV